MNFDFLGGRRFLLVLVVFVGTSALLWFGKLDAGSYANILQWTVGAYIAGNVAQRHIESRNKDGHQDPDHPV